MTCFAVSTEGADKYRLTVNDFVVHDVNGMPNSGGGGTVEGEGAGMRHAVTKGDALMRSRDNSYVNVLNSTRRPVYAVPAVPLYGRPDVVILKTPSFYYEPPRRFTYGVYIGY